MHIVGEQNTVPMNIGLIIPGQPTTPPEPVKLVIPGQPEREVRDTGGIILPEEKQVVDKDGEATSSMTWPHYVERRQFSCEMRRVDRATLEKNPFKSGGEPVNIKDYILAACVQFDQVEDVAQATLEFVGEVAELSELIGAHGVKALWGDNRNKLVDECGDILFTGTWLIEAWARNPIPEKNGRHTLEHILDERPVPNPLLAATDTELYRFEEGDVHASIALAIMQAGGMRLQQNRNFMQTASSVLLTDILQAMTYSGLTANAAKKLIYQHREQDAKLQIERVLGTFFAVNFILCMANSSIEEAMIANRKKLDSRYPSGFQAGVGGGIRTEG